MRALFETPVFFESYAAIYLVSARTGRLASWQRLSAKRAQPVEAEKVLLEELAAENAINSQKQNMRRALEKESAERAHAIESGAPIIEVMTEENAEKPGARGPQRPPPSTCVSGGRRTLRS